MPTSSETPPLDTALLDVLAAGSRGVLATIKRDGRPQLSTIDYAYDPSRQVVQMSTTLHRAKTRNLRRDPRGSLYSATEGGGAWVVVEGRCDLTPPAAARGDATVESLISVYRAIQGEHPDWDDYRAAMVADGRLVITLHVEHAYGWAP